MKKFIASLFVLLMAGSVDVMAQYRGDVYIGGDLGLGVSHSKVSFSEFGSVGDGSTGVSFSIMPKIGVFVADRFMVGFGFGYSLEATDIDNRVHTLTLGPTLSYYVPLSDSLYYTPTIDLLFCYGTSEGAGVPGFGLGATLFGMEYRPTSRLGISGSLLSLNYVLLAKEGVQLHEVDFGLSLNPTIGFKFYF